MPRAINVQAAVHTKDYVAALRMTAEKTAADLDAAEDPTLRSTLARMLSTVLTSLRLAEAAAPAKSAGGGKSTLEILREQADAG